MLDFDPTLGGGLADNQPDNDFQLVKVKEPRTPKQETVLDAILNHAIPKATREINVDPALEYLRDEHGQSYTGKGYLWQVTGEFVALVHPGDASQYREGYQDGHKDGFAAGRDAEQQG